jgi:hypothetical protein
VKLRRAPATLAALDAFEGDLVCVTLFEDERPLRGAAGLCDWRTAGWLTEALRAGRLAGAAGEAVLFPPWPPGRRLRARAIAAVGLGARARFDAAALAAGCAHLARLAAGFGALRLCTQVPPFPDAADALASALAAALPDDASCLLLE